MFTWLFEKIKNYWLESVFLIIAPVAIKLEHAYVPESFRTPRSIVYIFTAGLVYILYRFIKFKMNDRLHDPCSQYKMDEVCGFLIAITYDSDEEKIKLIRICPICGARTTFVNRFDTDVIATKYGCADENHWFATVKVEASKAPIVTKREFEQAHESMNRYIKEKIIGRVRFGDWKNASKRVTKIRREAMKHYRERVKNEPGSVDD